MALQWFSNGGTQNATISYTSDTFNFNPLEAWSNAHSNANVPFTSSSTANSTVTVTFPCNATAFRWQGLKRAMPASYSICVDCADLSDGILVDGLAQNGESTETVTTLFSQDNMSNTPHVITIRNLVDARSGTAGELTISGIVIFRPIPTGDQSASSSTDKPSGSTTSSSSSTQSNTSPSSTPVASSQSSAPSSTSTTSNNGSDPNTAYWSSDHTDDSRTPTSKGVIVGATITGAVAIFGSMGLLWWYATRKRRAYAKLSSSSGGGGEGDLKRPPKRLILSSESPITKHVKQVSFSDDADVYSDAAPRSNNVDLERNMGFVSRENLAAAPPLITFSPPRHNASEIRRSPGHTPTPSFAKHPQFPNPTIKETHASSISSSTSSRPARPPPPQAPSPQWGIIPVALNNPFSSPAPGRPEPEPDYSSGSEYDYDSPLPSSEIHVSRSVSPFAFAFEDGSTMREVKQHHYLTTVTRADLSRHQSSSPDTLRNRSEGEDTLTPTPTGARSRGWMKVDVSPGGYVKKSTPTTGTRPYSLRDSVELYPQSVRSVPSNLDH